MARYDRIAPLAAPSRDHAYPVWLVLRDLEGCDREGDLARRARLRFLALRPLRRLLDRGVTSVTVESFGAQIEAAREELGYLPARDVERVRLARFLHELEGREPARLIRAALEIADACVSAGHSYGAEEYALTAQGLAAVCAEYRLQGVASTTLARIYRMRAQWSDVDACVAKALAIAQRVEHRLDLVRARGELAFSAAARGNAATARSVLQETVQEMRAARDAQAEALAQAKFCACELALGNATGALEHGRPALLQLDDVRERAALIEHVGAAFAATGLHKAAERCFSLIAQRGIDAALRARARAAQAVQSAAIGEAIVFRDRRTALLSESSEWLADPRAAASVHLELGRGCVIVQDVDFARDHLRIAITTARKHGLEDVLTSAEAILTALESNTTSGLLPASKAGPATAAARSLAEQLDSLPDFSMAGT